jgi:hypothetical protein
MARGRKKPRPGGGQRRQAGPRGRGVPGRRRRGSHPRRPDPWRRVEALLKQSRGHSDASFDQRPEGERAEPKVLSVRRNRDLFDRLAIQDYEYLLSLVFAAPADVLRILLPQSVLGRALNGHGWFVDARGRPLVFADASFDRVLTALEKLDPNLRHDRVRQARGLLVEQVVSWVRAQREEPELRLEHAGRPLLGVELLRGRSVAAGPFLKGMVLAGCMDDWRQRQMTMAHHRFTFGGDPLEIGGGEVLMVDPAKLAAVGLVDPGRVEFTDEDLRGLRRLGVIVDTSQGPGPWRYPQYDQGFFRRRLCDGVSDDLALVYLGARYGFAALLGGFVMDALDTYDKFLWEFTPGGSDAALAQELQQWHQERHGRPLATGEEIFDLIHFAAKLNFPPVTLSSSHRRFIQTEDGARLSTLLHHARFLDGGKLDDFRLGYSRVPSRDFYTTAWSRLHDLDFDIPEPDFRKKR